jgi:uncharacterized integral membrane protein (TIGR00698 family)
MQKAIFFIALFACLCPIIDPPVALLLGFGVAQTVGHPFLHLNSKATGWLLKIAVVGLGFGMNVQQALDAGQTGLMFTIFSICLTFLFGWLVGKWLDIDPKIAYLISSGTAICGGSAIAAVAPVIGADGRQISVALGTVFILNSVALLIFPTIGHWLNMSEHQFGLWCAIAIHDTSSVVGASAKYGSEALQVATTVKLTRALWIIPLSIVTVFTTKSEHKKINLPYFIGFFVAAMCFATYFPQFKTEYSTIVAVAKKGLTVTLFLIGAGLSFETLKAVGIRPLIQGVVLWLLISVVSLLIILW